MVYEPLSGHMLYVAFCRALKKNPLSCAVPGADFMSSCQPANVMPCRWLVRCRVAAAVTNQAF